MRFKAQLIIHCFLISASFSCAAQTNSIVAAGAELFQISNAYSFTGGPASDRNGNVFFTDQPNDQIIKWIAADSSLHVFKKPSGRANGLYFDQNGYLLAAADAKNELWRIDEDGKADTLITQFQNKKLNGPNDLWVDSKRGIYFTDPYYQRPY